VASRIARVLVVDDELTNRALLVAQLGAEGYAVTTAPDGQAGLAAAIADPPSLILLDVAMPGLDGFEVLAQLKAHPRTRAVPVALITSLADRENRLRGLAAGADDFVSRPIDSAELSARVRSLVRSKALSDELARSNAELAEFAYVASHDLQEPLRMVASYPQLLRRRYKDRLDQDANQFIDFAVDGATRMQQVINDLLAYSHVGTHPGLLQRTDTAAVIDQVLIDLGTAIEETDARVTRDALPVVNGNGRQLELLFQHLIANAIKYRRVGVPPRIHLRAVREGPAWRFDVEDNGIGLDPQYANRIFQLFQRLHAREAYPGTGVGLAICKKIVERHEGRIWVQSTPATGSIFSFTLPATASAARL
jgi:two-component system, sensor histidine kinase and response regulator